jgi:hypothetical protein
VKWKGNSLRKDLNLYLLANHDTIIQLLARSRYFIQKTNQSGLKPNKRAEILFKLYPDIKEPMI